jgi:hypothetical protein
MLTKESTFLESFAEGMNLVYRQKVTVLEDGAELISQTVSVVLKPSDSALLSSAPPSVQALAAVLWNQAALKDYEATLDKQILARIKAKELQLKGLDDARTRAN